MTEQRTTDAWFEAVRVPDDWPEGEDGRGHHVHVEIVATWEKCGHRHVDEPEARACAAARGPRWRVTKARRVETQLGEGS